MQHYLIRRLNLWSVARTVFPLAWLTTIVLFFLNVIFWGGLVVHWARQLGGYEVPLGGEGVVLGLFLSVFFGFLSAVALTITAIVLAFFYNLLAGLGGGVTLDLTEAPDTGADSAESP